MPIAALYIFPNAHYTFYGIFLTAYYVFYDICSKWPMVLSYHICKWPIIVLYIFPNAYCVDMTFLYGLLCYDTYIFQVIFFKYIIEIY